MNTFTPGPWRVHAPLGCLQADVRAQDGRIVARIGTRDTLQVGGEELADARLIAAAPELLSEVKRLSLLLASACLVIEDKQAREVALDACRRARALTDRAQGTVATTTTEGA